MKTCGITEGQGTHLHCKARSSERQPYQRVSAPSAALAFPYWIRCSGLSAPGNTEADATQEAELPLPFSPRGLLVLWPSVLLPCSSFMLTLQARKLGSWARMGKGPGQEEKDSQRVSAQPQKRQHCCMHLPALIQRILSVGTPQGVKLPPLSLYPALALHGAAGLPGLYPTAAVHKAFFSFLRRVVGEGSGCQRRRLPPLCSISLWLGTLWDLGLQGDYWEGPVMCLYCTSFSRDPSVTDLLLLSKVLNRKPLKVLTQHQLVLKISSCPIGFLGLSTGKGEDLYPKWDAFPRLYVLLRDATWGFNILRSSFLSNKGKENQKLHIHLSTHTPSLFRWSVPMANMCGLG